MSDADGRLGEDELLAYHGRFANDEGVMRGAPSGRKRAAGGLGNGHDAVPAEELQLELCFLRRPGAEPEQQGLWLGLQRRKRRRCRRRRRRQRRWRQLNCSRSRWCRQR